MARKSRSAARSSASRSSGTNYFEGRFLSEFAGTLILVLLGCGTAVINGFGAPAQALQIGMAFGLVTTAVMYSIGLMSGGHINPAVTLAYWAAGRIRTSDAIPYIVWQLLGAVAGAALLVLIQMGKGQSAAVTNLWQNGYGPGFLGGYGVGAAIGVEFLATLIFALVVLGATAVRGGVAVAGLVIGLTLVGLHLAFVNVTGLSVNPARSLGPAVFVGGTALTQLWVFLLVPSVAGLIAGWLVKRCAMA